MWLLLLYRLLLHLFNVTSGIQATGRRPEGLLTGDEDGAHAAQTQFFHRTVLLRKNGFGVSAAFLGNVQQAIATQQIENNVTFRWAELPGFLHFYPARLFAFQQGLYLFL
ncbi:hypothetical protein D3C73_1200580 [compost metagenome]